MKLFLLTGANGHLGSALLRALSNRGQEVRGLVLPGEAREEYANVSYYEGDVRSRESLLPLFEGTEGREVVFIHAAGIVSIAGNISEALYDVNVNGTRQVCEVCLEKRVSRLVYVSSVHAIPEKDKMGVLSEVSRFSPDEVTGGYAKTKAEATQYVLDQVSRGLNAVVVHPSGIIGPYDSQRNHIVQMVRDYLSGRLPACVKGGYDFVDVRDVAEGCILAAEKGQAGECYILSNRHYEVRELLSMVKAEGGGRRLPVLPLWMARAFAPTMGWMARLCRRRPLYTKYSLYTLGSNDRFSHDKATSQLGYCPRDMRLTIADTVRWLKARLRLRKST